LNTPDPLGTLRDIFQERQDVYALADASVKANKDLSIDEMSDRVIDALLTRPDVLEQIHD
jgi:shikimate kinase